MAEHLCFAAWTEGGQAVCPFPPGLVPELSFGVIFTHEKTNKQTKKKCKNKQKQNKTNKQKTPKQNKTKNNNNNNKSTQN